MRTCSPRTAVGCLFGICLLAPPPSVGTVPLFVPEFTFPAVPPEQAVPEYPWVHIVEAHDLNGDERTDLIVVLETASEGWPDEGYLLVIYHRDADGGFDAPQIYPGGFRSESLAVGDWNGDGLPDLAIPDGSHVTIYFQGGDGRFAGPFRFSTERIPHRILSGDFDGDGDDDLALVPWGTDYVEILHQRPGKEFGRSRLKIDHYGYEAATTGDFNGDGFTDIAIVSGQGALEGVRILIQDGRGGFKKQRHIAYSINEPHSAVAAGDVDGDGLDDLAVAVAFPYGGDHAPHVAILRQTPEASFTEAVLERPEFRGAGAIALEDVNQDGKADLLVLNSESLLVCATGSDGIPGPCMGYGLGGLINANNPEAIAVNRAGSSGNLEIVTAVEFAVFTLRHRANAEHPLWLPARTDFSFYTMVSDSEGKLREMMQEPSCIPATACASGALPGRSEVFLRIVGPKPNGRLWPTLVKFTTSPVEVWALQESTRRTLYYRLPASRPGDDRLIGLFDPIGFKPMSLEAQGMSRRGSQPPPPGEFLASEEIPGFRFKIRIRANGEVLEGRAEPDCIPETLCVSGAVAGRSELFLRVTGPRPNGLLWPILARFSTSEIEVWIEQIASGDTRYYRLPRANRFSGRLIGLFDRDGFLP